MLTHGFREYTAVQANHSPKAKIIGKLRFRFLSLQGICNYRKAHYITIVGGGGIPPYLVACVHGKTQPIRTVHKNGILSTFFCFCAMMAEIGRLVKIFQQTVPSHEISRRQRKSQEILSNSNDAQWIRKSRRQRVR